MKDTNYRAFALLVWGLLAACFALGVGLARAGLTLGSIAGLGLVATVAAFVTLCVVVAYERPGP